MSKMFKKPKQAAQAAPIAAAAPIPVQDAAVTDAAKKKAAAQLQQRGGVASTVLSDTLGG